MCQPFNVTFLISSFCSLIEKVMVSCIGEKCPVTDFRAWVQRTMQLTSYAEESFGFVLLGQQPLISCSKPPLKTTEL